MQTAHLQQVINFFYLLCVMKKKHLLLWRIYIAMFLNTVLQQLLWPLITALISPLQSGSEVKNTPWLTHKLSEAKAERVWKKATGELQ